MITKEMFISKIEEIALEDPAYRTGGTGADGTCDCIGLVIGAIRRSGGKWTGLKGTNYAARNEVVSLLPLDRASDLIPGEAVFKAREPGEEGYDRETLRSRYASSPDPRDYYHIGIVESSVPLRIRHMTSPRVRMDTSPGKWKYHGWLKQIRKGEPAPMETVLIYGGNPSSPVNLRSSGALTSPILAKIPQHTAADLLESADGWCRVKACGREGFVQAAFVHRSAEAGPAESPDSGWVKLPRRKLEALRAEIEDWLRESTAPERS